MSLTGTEREPRQFPLACFRSSSQTETNKHLTSALSIHVAVFPTLDNYQYAVQTPGSHSKQTFETDAESLGFLSNCFLDYLIFYCTMCNSYKGCRTEKRQRTGILKVNKQCDEPKKNKKIKNT